MEVFKRTRDFIRNVKPVGQITYEEWQDIVDRYTEAKKFMSDKGKIVALMKEDLKNAEDVVLENRFHEVREERTIIDTLKKIFIVPKEEQLNELVGQVKLLRGYLKEIQSWIDRKEKLEKDEADGRIIIQREEVVRKEK